MMKKASALAIVVCTISGAAAHAQVIEPSDEPAATIDTFPRTSPASPGRATQQSRLAFSFDAYGSATFTSNGLSASNLPQGLDLEATDDIIYQVGVRAGPTYRASQNVTLFGRAGISRAAYGTNELLNYYNAAGVVGAFIEVNSRIALLATGSCNSERDEDFDEYYQLCSASAGIIAVAGNPNNGTGTEFGARVTQTFGEEDLFARYTQATVNVRFEAGRNTRFRFEPRYSYTMYATNAGFGALGGDREDHQLSIGAAVFKRFDKLELGFQIDPRINWSSFGQYRYWDLRAGPFFSYRF